MNRRKRPLAIVVVFLLLLFGLPCWLVYRQVEQEREDQMLIKATREENTPRALELLEEGADANAREMGDTLSYGQVLQRFLDRLRHHRPSPAGKPVDDKHLPALVLLYHQPGMLIPLNIAPGPDITLLRALLDHHAQVNDRDAEGRNPLWWACRCCNADAVRLLLERGADTEATDLNGNTPLMEAGEDAAVTRVLLEHGARTETRDANGQTALLLATMNVAYSVTDGGVYAEVARLLLEHGARVSPRDARGQTALDYVMNDPYPNAESRKIVTLLRQHGAKESP